MNRFGNDPLNPHEPNELRISGLAYRAAFEPELHPEQWEVPPLLPLSAGFNPDLLLGYARLEQSSNGDIAATCSLRVPDSWTAEGLAELLRYERYFAVGLLMPRGPNYEPDESVKVVSIAVTSGNQDPELRPFDMHGRITFARPGGVG